MRTHYRKFEPRFHDLVAAGRKRQTIRPVPKRERDIPKPGDIIVCQAWTELPYRSKVRELCRGRVTTCTPMKIHPSGFFLGDPHYDYGSGTFEKDVLDDLARADGFADWAEMSAWFSDRHRHKLPFRGILIRWEPIFPNVTKT